MKMDRHNTDIYPFDKIRTQLIDLLDSDEFLLDEVRNLSRSKLAEHYNDVKDAKCYFEVMNNNFEEDDLLEFLINLTDYMELHVKHGSINVSKMIGNCKQELEKRRMYLQQMGIAHDENFVGREQVISDLIKWIHDLDCQFKGVSICGMGGMGKTSLANQICINVWNNRPSWTPLKINLREQRSVKELIYGTMACMNLQHNSFESETDNSSHEDIDYFSKRKRFLIDEICKRKRSTVLLFDNIDDILESDLEELYKFFIELLERISRPRCKVKIIITSRQQLLEDHDKSPRELVARLKNVLQEHEVKKLSKENAHDLFLKCTRKMEKMDNHISPSDRQTILEHCGYCPLVIRTVCSTLQTGFLTAKTIILNLNASGKNMQMTHILRVDNCLKESFDRLNKIYQTKLMQLSAYQTAEFSVEDAVALWGKSDSLSEVKSKLDLVYLKSRHFIEISDDFLEDDKSHGKTTRKSYSLHPLVFRFLREKEDAFKVDMKKADENFIDHIRGCITKIAKMLKDTDKSDIGRRKLNKLTPHIDKFRVLLSTYSEKIPKFQENEKTTEMLLTGEIYRQALSLEGRNNLYNNVINNTTCVLKKMYWLTEKAKFYLDIDKSHECHETLIQVQTLMEENGQFNNPQDADHKTVLAHYYFMKTRLANKENKPLHESITDIDKAIDLLEDQKLKEDCRYFLPDIYNMKGCILFKNKKFDSALKFHEKALNSQHQIDNKARIYTTNIATCYYQLGVRNDSSGDSKTCMRLLKKAELFYKKTLDLHTGSREDEAKILTNLGKLYFSMEEYDKAIQKLKESVCIKENVLIPPHRDIILALHDLGDLMRRIGTIHLRKDEKDKCKKCSSDGVEYYEKIMKMVRNGGLRTCDEIYRDIIQSHKVLLKRSFQRCKIQEMERFYSDFESGKFDKRVRKMSSIDQMMKTSVDKSLGVTDDRNSSDESSLSSPTNSSPRSSTSPTSSDTDDSEVASTSDTEHERMESDYASDKTTIGEDIANANLKTNNTISKIDNENDHFTNKYKQQESRDSGQGTSVSTCGGSLGSISESSENTKKEPNPRLYMAQYSSSFEEVFSPSSSRRTSLFSSQESSIDDEKKMSLIEMTQNSNKSSQKKNNTRKRSMLKRQHSIDDGEQLVTPENKDKVEIINATSETTSGKRIKNE